MKLLRNESLTLGALPPSPRDLSHSRQNDGARRQIARPPLIPAADSALGLRPRSALSSAQVLPEWITSTSPCNDLSANGDNPLNSLSHSRGSVQIHPPNPTTVHGPVKVRVVGMVWKGHVILNGVPAVPQSQQGREPVKSSELPYWSSSAISRTA